MPGSDGYLVCAGKPGATSVTLNYSAGSGWTIPADETETISWGSWSSGTTFQTRTGSSNYTVYRESDLYTTWSWTFTGSGNTAYASSKSGSVTITGLSAGYHGTNTGSISCSRRYRTYTNTYSQVRTYKDGKWIEGTVSKVSSKNTTGSYYIGSNSYSVGYYTHPPTFTWDVTPAEGVLISESLTATKWTELMNDAAAWYNWNYCQSGGTPKSKKTSWVNSGDLITQEIYNLAASYLGIAQLTDYPQILASYFLALSDKINSY